VPGAKTPPAKTTKKKLSEDPYNLNSPGWAGDEPEMLWADAVRRTVSAKISKIDGYQPCHKYWLVIHDTWDMSVIVKLPKAVYYLTEKLTATNIVFEEVFVICNRRMVCIRHDGLDIVDLPGEGPDCAPCTLKRRSVCWIIRSDCAKVAVDAHNGVT
jgi:hypothetical protein